MIYCLMTEDRKVRVEISCSVAARPKGLLALAMGVEEGIIQMIKPKKFKSSLEIGVAHNQTLISDWERTGIGSRLINWPKMEDL